MVRDEAPAATFRGVNERESDRAEIGFGWVSRLNFRKRSGQPRCCGNPSWTLASGHLRRLAALQHSSCVPSRFEIEIVLNQQVTGLTWNLAVARAVNFGQPA
jgi:hypothetical protein